MVQSMYFNLKRTLSYNALFNVILGGRGIGKSYACKWYALQRYLKHGEQFVYLRRYDSELVETAPLYFSDIQNDEKWPKGVEILYKGGVYSIEDETIGYALSLSRAQHYKSASFPKVSTIIFDEFIIENEGGASLHYLPNETFRLQDIYETIARTRDNVRLFMLANAITISNPYFLDWNLSIPDGKDIAVHDEILVQMAKTSEDFLAKKTNTRFGKIAAKTGYAGYAVQNNFYLDDSSLIMQRDKTSILIYVLEYKGKKYGLWSTQYRVFLFSRNIFEPFTRTLNLDRADIGEKAYKNSAGYLNPIYKRLRGIIRNGNYGFETKEVQAELKPLLGRLL